MADKIALYLRLSVDDENMKESDSIANQRDLLEGYVASNTALSSCEVLTFLDDGWSGTNFERPGVQKLLDLVRGGEISQPRYTASPASLYFMKVCTVLGTLSPGASWYRSNCRTMARYFRRPASYILTITKEIKHFNC